MGDADLWELLRQHGISPDSATAIVQSHKGMGDADLWERLVQNGADKSAATQIVQSRSAPNTDINSRNLLRSAGQGATFGFSDELGLASRDAQKAFQKQHPVADFFAKLGGGLLAPAVIAAAAPEVLAGAGIGTAVAAGAGAGALTGAGEAEGSLTNRLKPAAEGAVVGAGAGAAGYAGAKALRSAGSLLFNKIAPNVGARNAVSEAARGLLDSPDAVAAHINEVNALAPGGSSIASAAVAPETRASRFLSMARAVGASKTAGAQSEASLAEQSNALAQGMRDVGSKMDALGGDVPVTPQVRSAMSKVQSVLGSKAPEVPTAALDANPLGLEKSSGFSFDPQQKTMNVQDMRDALSRLRYAIRQADKRGIDANGVTKKDLTDAASALRDVLYDHADGFRELDRQYASLANELRAVNGLTKTVERSRQNYAANDAFGATAGSLGGSLPKGAHGVVMTLLDHVLSNKGAAADAVSKYILTPGDATAVQDLLRYSSRRVSPRLSAATTAGLLTSPPSVLRGLLFPAPSEQ